MKRQEKRAIEKKKKKDKKKLDKKVNKLGDNFTPPLKPQTPSTSPQPSPLDQKLNAVNKDLNTIFNHSKSVDDKFNLLINTMERLGFLSREDLKETELVYAMKEQTKLGKIKNLLQSDLTLRESLEAIKESPDLPQYQRLAIDPVRDLNLNPYEIVQLLRDDFPSQSKEELYELGSKEYKLSKMHFGIK
ncbi:hypothetical protein N9948_00455 [bacterium]|nr:hypothetical protein [bacterium]